MGLFDAFRRRNDTAEREYADDLAQETAKVKAYRTAEEIVVAAEALMKKAVELRTEIEGLSDE